MSGVSTGESSTHRLAMKRHQNVNQLTKNENETSSGNPTRSWAQLQPKGRIELYEQKEHLEYKTFGAKNQSQLVPPENNVDCCDRDPRSRVRLESSAKNTSAANKNLTFHHVFNASYCDSGDTKVLEEIRTTYFSSRKATDSYLRQLDSLQTLVQKAGSGFSQENVSREEIVLARRFLEWSRCGSLKELGEMLNSHRVFILSLLRYFESSNIETENNENIRTSQSDDRRLHHTFDKTRGMFRQQKDINDNISEKRATIGYQLFPEHIPCIQSQIFAGDHSEMEAPRNDNAGTGDTQQGKHRSPLGNLQIHCNLRLQTNQDNQQFVFNTSRQDELVKCAEVSDQNSPPSTDQEAKFKLSVTGIRSSNQVLNSEGEAKQRFIQDESSTIIKAGILKHIALADVIGAPLRFSDKILEHKMRGKVREEAFSHDNFNLRQSTRTSCSTETNSGFSTAEPSEFMSSVQTDLSGTSYVNHSDFPTSCLKYKAESRLNAPTETWQSRVRRYYSDQITKTAPSCGQDTSRRGITNDNQGWRPKVAQLQTEFCSQCGETFRWPHLLDCFHRFCFPCLVRIFRDQESSLQCPICSYVTPAQCPFSGPGSLKLDYPLVREMCQAGLFPFSCSGCRTDEDAVVFCPECPQYMCQLCCLLHIQSETTSGHSLQNSDAKIGARSNGELWPTCSSHPGQFVSGYCAECTTPVCQSCSEAEHSLHRILSLADVVSGARKVMGSANAQLINMKGAYQKALMSLNQSKQRLDSLHRSERHNITNMSNHLLQHIENLRKKATSLADDAFDQIKLQVFAACDDMGLLYKKLQAFAEFTGRYAQFREPYEVVSFYPLVKKTYSQLLRLYNCQQAELGRKLTTGVKFDPAYPEVTSSIQETFSSLKWEYTCFLAHQLTSPLVLDRHQTEPCEPQPYSLEYRCRDPEIDTKSSGRSLGCTGSAATVNYEGSDPFLSRKTLPCSRSLGHYGRGEYEFAEPSGVLYLHDCSLAVCDTRNHRIAIYNQDGSFQRTIGQPDLLPGLSVWPEEGDKTFPRNLGKLYFPYRMAQCPQTKHLVVLERPPSLDIQSYTFEGGFLRCFGNNVLQNPRGITVDERGLILVLESKTMNFFIFSSEGELIHKCVLGILEFPNDVTARDGMIYISDNRHHCVKCFDYSLNYRQQVGDESWTYYPISVGFNHKGHLVVTDNHNTFNITVFGPDGRVVSGFKSQAKHANCYNVALHPLRAELAVSTREHQVLVFVYD